ncbi:MAG: thioredoxin [Proteobacteria bacterium]|nr:thioredoxin [Pseudomonadota bacterium]HQR04748.1 thioredoxin [Rhodocyclaceae bacterium]
MSIHIHDINPDNFKEKVIDASFQAPVLVDFWAEWCGPCRTLGPILEKLAGEYDGRFTLAKVNADENQELAAQFGVRSIPSVKVVFQGRLVDEFTGALPESQIRAFLDALLPPAGGNPLLEAAREARVAGDNAAARQLLTQAVAADNKDEAAYLELADLCLETGELEDARQIIAALAPTASDKTRLESLQARLTLIDSGAASADTAPLEARIGADPRDFAAREELAKALAARGNYREALTQLLEIVRLDRQWGEEAGRRAMIDLFNLLAGQEAHLGLVREFRTALSRTLN